MIRLLDGRCRVYRFASQSPIQNDFLKPEDHKRIVALFCGERVSASNLFPESSFFCCFLYEKKSPVISLCHLIYPMMPTPTRSFPGTPGKEKSVFDALMVSIFVCELFDAWLWILVCQIFFAESFHAANLCFTNFFERIFCQIFQTRNGLNHKPIGMQPIKSINNLHRRNC